MPNAFELPRVLCAVVPLVRGQRLAGWGRSVVHELVAFTFRHAIRRSRRLSGGGSRLVPGFSAVVGALNDLAEPAAGLRDVDPVRIDRRTFDVVNLPAGEVRAADLPAFAAAVGGEDKRALAGANEETYRAHAQVLSHRKRFCRSNENEKCLTQEARRRKAGMPTDGIIEFLCDLAPLRETL